LQERDAAFERWLREELVPTYDATKADPSSRVSAKAVFAEARALQRTAQGASLNRRILRRAVLEEVGIRSIHGSGFLASLR
jgi:hypothetical protein